MPDSLPYNLWQVGDIVSRDGTDEHEVVALGDLMTFRCIKAPSSGWIKVGEEERNVPWRYEFLRGGAR